MADNRTIGFRHVRKEPQKGFLRVKHTPARGYPVAGESVGGEGIVQHCRCIDRLRKMLAPCAKMSYMVQMVMGHEDGLE